MTELNPYIIGDPIRDSDLLFGRTHLLQFVSDNLNNRSRLIILFGPRRIGKSSILSQIPLFIQEENFIFVPFDLQNHFGHSLGNIIHSLALEIIKYSDISASSLKVSDSENVQHDNQQVSELFLTNVLILLAHRKLVLLIDEFDSLENHSGGRSFSEYLESLLRNQQNLFAVAVIGRYLEDIPEPKSLFKSAARIRIDLLAKADARKLIIEPAHNILEYKETAIQSIWDLTGGHPYLTQAVCYTVFRQAQTTDNWTVDAHCIESIIEDAVMLAEGGLAWFRDGLSIVEKIVITSVAESDAIYKSDKRRFKLSNFRSSNKDYRYRQTLKRYDFEIDKRELEEAERNLIRWGLLRKVERTTFSGVVKYNYELTINIIKYWIANRYPLLTVINEYQNANSSSSTISESLPFNRISWQKNVDDIIESSKDKSIQYLEEHRMSDSPKNKPSNRSGDAGRDSGGVFHKVRDVNQNYSSTFNVFSNNTMIISLILIFALGGIGWLIGIRIQQGENGIDIKMQEQSQSSPEKESTPIAP